eukprot:1308685-Prymnesium_polylepis.2
MAKAVCGSLPILRGRPTEQPKKWHGRWECRGGARLLCGCACCARNSSCRWPRTDSIQADAFSEYVTIHRATGYFLSSSSKPSSSVLKMASQRSRMSPSLWPMDKPSACRAFADAVVPVFGRPMPMTRLAAGAIDL